MKTIHPSEITPQRVYFNRRQLIAGAGSLALASLLGACSGESGREPDGQSRPPASGTPPATGTSPDPTAVARRLQDQLTPKEDVTGYINFYEFTLSKTNVARLASDFQTSPWDVEVGGLVHKPRTFALEDLLAFQQEERIYRMRCVEAWS
ncbi:MAG: molybdopterin-dependent oxidoreductase, partial [Chloroflexota bacterium]